MGYELSKHNNIRFSVLNTVLELARVLEHSCPKDFLRVANSEVVSGGGGGGGGGRRASPIYWGTGCVIF